MRFSVLIIAVILNLGMPPSAQGADAPPVKVYLPRPAETVPGIRIGWYIHDLKGALQAAQSQNKMVVAIFREDLCGWCALQLAHVLRCEAFNELAGRAVFAIGSPSKDPDFDAMAISLGIDFYPALTVLDIKGTNMNEQLRISGFEPESALVSQLRKALKLGAGPLYAGSQATKRATEVYYGEPKPVCVDDVAKRVPSPHSTPAYRQ
jgi:hypothetical protein